MSREIVRPQTTLVEEIVSYEYHQSGSVVAKVAIGEWVVGRTIKPDPQDPSKDYTLPDYFEINENHRRETVEISGDDYDALMSDAPAWHPEKKGNMFERNDLWYAIDAKRSGNALAHGNDPSATHTPPSSDAGAGNANNGSGTP